MINSSQRTINSEVSCSGIGLHSGAEVTINLLPAAVNSGIVFKRIDIKEGDNVIKADYKNVTDTKLGTTISNEHGHKVSTIEHLMAAIWGCGIDNLIIEINAAEVPIMDGSSEPFVFLIECAGANIQEAPRHVIEIMKKIKIQEGDKAIEVEPAREFSLDLHIDFDHKHIQKQNFDYNSTFASFKNDICRARTFGFKHEIDYLHTIGLAKGGSLDNAVLVDENGVVNKDGLRYSDEFVRHKALDFIGDIYLAGYHIIGHFKAAKSGHTINNKMLHKIFEDKTAWRII